MLSFFGMRFSPSRGFFAAFSLAAARRILQAEGFPETVEHRSIFDHIAEPCVERHLAPRNRPLHQIRHRAVRFGPAEVLRDVRETAQRVLASANGSGRGAGAASRRSFLPGDSALRFL